jgi:predicted regulator of Ras-like GTPase activity (Roadblock/LC7/MglB family)
MADEEDFNKIQKSHDDGISRISDNNEQKMLNTLISLLRNLLDAFPNSAKEDVNLLRNVQKDHTDENFGRMCENLFQKYELFGEEISQDEVVDEEMDLSSNMKNIICYRLGQKLILINTICIAKERLNLEKIRIKV